MLCTLSFCIIHSLLKNKRNIGKKKVYARDDEEAGERERGEEKGDKEGM